MELAYFLELASRKAPDLLASHFIEWFKYITTINNVFFHRDDTPYLHKQVYGSRYRYTMLPSPIF